MRIDRAGRLVVWALALTLGGCHWNVNSIPDTGTVDTWQCTCQGDDGGSWQGEVCEPWPFEEAYFQCTILGGIAYARDCYDCVCLPVDGGCG